MDFLFQKIKKQIVYQCKNKIIARDDKKIQAELLHGINTEVKSVNAKFSNIDMFVFANSFKQDTVLQDKALDLLWVIVYLYLIESSRLKMEE